MKSMKRGRPMFPLTKKLIALPVGGSIIITIPAESEHRTRNMIYMTATRRGKKFSVVRIKGQSFEIARVRKARAA